MTDFKAPQFQAGQRVKVPKGAQGPDSTLYGREGTIVFVGSPMFFIDQNGRPTEDAQQYEVKFKGLEETRAVPETWLVPN